MQSGFSTTQGSGAGDQLPSLNQTSPSKVLFSASLGSRETIFQGSTKLSITAGGVVGPATYEPNYFFTKPRPKTVSFSKTARFLPPKLSYISSNHNSELLCTTSPGPIYNVSANNPTKRAAPAYHFAPPPLESKFDDLKLPQEARMLLSMATQSQTNRENQRSTFLAGPRDSVGPAAYTPKFDLLKKQPPLVHFANPLEKDRSKFKRLPDRPVSVRDPTGIDVPGPGTYFKAEDKLRLEEEKRSRLSSPALDATGRSLPRPTDRGFGVSNRLPLNFSDSDVGPGTYAPKDLFVAKKAPAFSFGPGKDKHDAINGKRKEVESTRNSFIPKNDTPGSSYLPPDSHRGFNTQARQRMHLNWVP